MDCLLQWCLILRSTQDTGHDHTCIRGGTSSPAGCRKSLFGKLQGVTFYPGGRGLLLQFVVPGELNGDVCQDASFTS